MATTDWLILKFIRAEISIRRVSLLALAAAALLLRAAPARAHAFGARYDLPLPLDFYLIGAGAVVAMSFAVMALVFRAPVVRIATPRIDLQRFGLLRALAHPAQSVALRVLSVGIFALVLGAGFFGAQDTLANFAPTFVWVIWWVGLAYVASLAGNIWPAVNPWSIVFTWLENAAGRFSLKIRPGQPLAWPGWLGVWPAVALFGLFAWLELISEAAERPSVLATMIVVYSGITWTGMFVFGRSAWLAGGEAFSLAFGVLGRFAPLSGQAGTDGGARVWHLRPYGAGLVTNKPCHPSMTVFVLLMLATVTFDGFKETPLWGSVSQWTASLTILHPLILGIHDMGFEFLVVLKTIVLALFPLLFFLVYRGVSWLACDVAESGHTTGEIAGLFVFSLVPIAVAYHLAHYFSYLLTAGQYIIPLASDPFGFGWDIFGTAGYEEKIGLVGARFVWYSAVIAIVVGHVFAVGIAHFVALRTFNTAAAALRSQIPFLFLMVAYTMVSLWILSQPVVDTGDSAARALPADTVVLKPWGFSEYCVELSAQEEVRYQFRADPSVDFNIHYHEGLTVRFPVRTSGIASHTDSYVAPGTRPYCLMWTNRTVTDLKLTYRVATP